MAVFKRSYDGTDARTGEKVRQRTEYYYGYLPAVNGRPRQRVRLTTDKGTSEQLLAKMKKEREAQAHGLADPRAAQLRKPLAHHLDDYERHLRGKGDLPKHVAYTKGAISEALAACHFTYAGDLSASAFSDWLLSGREGAGRIGPATSTSARSSRS
jgi:hypothetical protein